MAYAILFTVLVISGSVSCSLYSASICPDAFEGKCKCGLKEYGPYRVLQYITNCTNSGFTDAGMLKSLPQETEVLVFSGNKVLDLPLNIFGRNHSFGILETIDFSSNHIQTIKGKTFHGVNNVKTLILDNNDLYVISKDHHPRVFSNFELLETLSLRNTYTDKIKDYELYLYDIFIESNLMMLKNLYLDHNGLRLLHNEMFCPMKTLRSLSLGGNFIQGIDFNITCLPHLENLDLGDNLIPYLSRQAIRQLDDMPGLKLNLTANPFDCSCQMVDTGTFKLLRDVRSRVKVYDRSTFHCSNGNLEAIGRHLFNVNLSPCHDKLKLQGHLSKRSTAGIAILGVIIILMCTLLAGTAYMHRASLGIWAGNVYARIWSKGRYASLDEKEEEKEMEV